MYAYTVAHFTKIGRCYTFAILEGKNIESAEVSRAILVAGLVLRGGRVLVMRNIKYGLRIEPSGGKWEANETLEEAVVREMFEELKIRVRVLRLVGVYQTDVTKEGVFDVHTFLCDIVEGEPAVGEPHKCDGFEWPTPDEMEMRPEITQSLRSTLPDIRALLEAGIGQ